MSELKSLRGITNKDLKKIVKRVADAGWEVKQTSGNHLMIRNPESGGTTLCSMTPRSGHTATYLLRDLKKIGWTE